MKSNSEVLGGADDYLLAGIFNFGLRVVNLSDDLGRAVIDDGSYHFLLAYDRRGFQGEVMSVSVIFQQRSPEWRGERLFGQNMPGEKIAGVTLQRRGLIVSVSSISSEVRRGGFWI